jgi:hypothetical protein
MGDIRNKCHNQPIMLEVGSRVRVSSRFDNALEDMHGTVKSIDGDLYAIEFDEMYLSWTNGLHDCSGDVPSGRGHFLPEECLEPINMKEIIQQVIVFLEDHIIECDLDTGCGRCNDARRHVNNLRFLLC